MSTISRAADNRFSLRVDRERIVIKLTGERGPNGASRGNASWDPTGNPNGCRCWLVSKAGVRDGGNSTSPAGTSPKTVSAENGSGRLTGVVVQHRRTEELHALAFDQNPVGV